MTPATFAPRLVRPLQAHGRACGYPALRDWRARRWREIEDNQDPEL